MTTKGMTELRKLFASRYDALKTQLARRLGSTELASDALHDAYVRLARKDAMAQVESPQAYLLHTAFHAAIDRMRGDARDLGDGEIDELYQYVDPAAGPMDTLQIKFDLDRAVQAMQALPPRQRDILFSARIEGLQLKELADRWGISKRLVSRELQAAHAFCARHMARQDDAMHSRRQEANKTIP